MRGCLASFNTNASSQTFGCARANNRETKVVNVVAPPLVVAPSAAMQSVEPPRNRGLVYTFYSYKGGVGRSMALANVAVLLARSGKKVLVVDWDLEAPG